MSQGLPGASLCRAVSAALVTAAVASACGASHRQIAALPTAKLAGTLHELTQREPAGAVALVQTRRGAWRGASGRTSDGHPVAPGDRFGIESVTKTFVAAVALQLVGERRLSLDDPVERWLPGCVREGRRITIRELLNHTSGLASGMPTEFQPVSEQP